MAKKDGPPRSQEFIDDSDAALESDDASTDEVKPKSKGKKASKTSDSKQATKVCLCFTAWSRRHRRSHVDRTRLSGYVR
jgi:hypothetical protein